MPLMGIRKKTISGIFFIGINIKKIPLGGMGALIYYNKVSPFIKKT